MSAPAATSHSSAVARSLALENRRKRGVQAIKAAQRQLHLDDDTYRDMLHRLTGKRSATKLSIAEQTVVLDHLRHAGAENPMRANRAAGKRRPAPAVERERLLGKVNALLDALGRLKREPYTLAYADAICKRNGWADSVSFADGPSLHRLVGALSRTVRAAMDAKPTAAPTCMPATTATGSNA